MNNKPLISVIVITYNQSRYLKQTLASIFNQNIKEDFELIIADDASSDTTQNIIREYSEKYPNVVNAILRKKNIGAQNNFFNALNKARGLYVALCEGDDYWLDNNKLQTQIDFLEKNRNYIIHSGNAKIVSDDKILNGSLVGIYNKPKSYTIRSLATLNPLYTCTIMFRNIKFNKEMQKYLERKDLFFGDWSLYIALLQQSGLKAYKDTQVYSAYRKHDKGIYTSMSHVKVMERCSTHLVDTVEVLSDQVDKRNAVNKAIEYAVAANKEYLLSINTGLQVTIKKLEQDKKQLENQKLLAENQKLLAEKRYSQMLRNPILYFKAINIKIFRKILYKFNKI